MEPAHGMPHLTYKSRKTKFTVQELLAIMEEDPPSEPTDIVIFPPNEEGNVSDEDSDNEDGGIKNVNHIGKGILNQKGELVLHHMHDIQEANDFAEDNRAHSPESGNAEAQPGPSTANPLRWNPRRKVRSALAIKETGLAHSSQLEDISEEVPSTRPVKRRFTESPIKGSRVTPVPKKGKGRPRRVLFSNSSSSEDETFEGKATLPRKRNIDRAQSTTRNQLGEKIPQFPDSSKFNRNNLPIDPHTTKTPYDFMKIFISDSFVNKVVIETKRYAARQNGSAFHSKVDDSLIRASHAIMFMTGYLTPSSRRMYWEKREDTSNGLARRAMSRNAFDEVMRYTHFANSDLPKDDPFWKVSLLFKTLNETAAQFVEKPEYVSVDEAMIRYFGPHPLKQFIKGKPTRFGFKIWAMCSPSGELIHCVPYAGAKTKIFQYGLSQGPDVVYGLVENARLVPGSKVVCDNLFTSLDLLHHLSKKGIGVLGTMRQNRMNSLSLPSKKETNSMMRGDTKELYVEDDQTIIVWKDSKPVYVASNFVGKEPMGKCVRYSRDAKKKVDVDQPHLLKLYNRNMGGVDLLDNLCSCYSIHSRNRKWYWGVYNWFLNVSMVQAWRLYKKVGFFIKEKDMEKISLVNFIRSCVEMTIMVHGSNTTSNVSLIHAPANRQEIRKDQGNHMIIRTDKKGVCNHCQNRTSYRCRRCDVGLHPNCFEAYHK